MYTYSSHSMTRTQLSRFAGDFDIRKTCFFVMLCQWMTRDTHGHDSGTVRRIMEESCIRKLSDRMSLKHMYGSLPVGTYKECSVRI